MTAQSNQVCSRCGFSNVPGDVFCGSCGAFLEWEAKAADASGAAGADAAGRDPDVPAIGGPTASSEAPTVAWTQPGAGAAGAGTAGAGATAAGGVVPPLPRNPDGPGSDVGQRGPDGLLRCPACGVANQATRTFCQSCGAKLESAAARVTAPTKEQIAAAVAATPNRPPAPPAGSAAAGTRPAAKGSGGALKWLVVLALLGVLVGVGVVVGSSMLKGAGPASDASTAPMTPGASAAAGASGDVPSSADPGTAGASGDPTAQSSSGTGGTTPKSKALKLLSATASSVVGNLEKFQPGKAIDGDPATSWQEGAKQEKGQWIEVTFDPATVDRITIRNGYGASTALFRGNRRLKDVRISVGGGAPQSVTLKDTAKVQSIAVTGPAGATTLRITIVSTYPGTKTSVANTPFDDAAVSEIRVFGVAGS